MEQPKTTQDLAKALEACADLFPDDPKAHFGPRDLRRAALELRTLDRIRRAAERFIDRTVMADDDDGKGWRMIMIDDQGEPARADFDELLVALKSFDSIPSLVEVLNAFGRKP